MAILLIPRRRGSSIRRILILVTAFSAITTGAPATATAVVPTQWIAKVTTESLGRPPTAGGWNDWVAYYSTNGCTADTLKNRGASRYKSAEFLGLGYDNAERLLALYRGALNREPRKLDIDTFLPRLNAGTLRWSDFVDAIFNSAEFRALQPTICDQSNPAYGFDRGGVYPGSVGDLKDWAGNGASRTQWELQQTLDYAQPTNSTTTSCPTVNTVELEPKEVIRIGGVQAGSDPDNVPLRIPPCVKLTTIGAPDAQHYAKMARLVPNGKICAQPGPTCDHIELVRVGTGASSPTCGSMARA
jgi:hypothetical protein